MKFIASIHAYDCLDRVEATCTVREYQDYEQGPLDPPFRFHVSLMSEGIDNPQEWLRDALVGLLEVL